MSHISAEQASATQNPVFLARVKNIVGVLCHDGDDIPIFSQIKTRESCVISFDWSVHVAIGGRGGSSNQPLLQITYHALFVLKTTCTYTYIRSAIYMYMYLYFSIDMYFRYDFVIKETLSRITHQTSQFNNPSVLIS